MSINVIITLVVAFAVVLFSLFNAQVVTLNLINLKTVSLPMSFLVFFVFVIGAVFAGILSIQTQIEQAMTIRRLKKKLKDLKEATAAEGADTASYENRESREPVVRSKAAAETKGGAGSGGNTKKMPVTVSKTSAPTQKMRTLDPATDQDNNAVFEKKSVEAGDEDEDEGGLSSKLRDIALRRIQNG